MATTKSSTRKLAESGAEMMDNVREAGCAMGNLASESLDSVRNTAVDYFEQGRAKAREMSGEMQDRIREEPTKALLVAVGLGFLIGALWRRR